MPRARNIELRMASPVASATATNNGVIASLSSVAAPATGWPRMRRITGAVENAMT